MSNPIPASSQAVHLTPSHYDDIVDERACAKVCGYPLCDAVVASAAGPRYHISMKDNRVYDLTERRKFCSGTCFEASTLYHTQMDSSPLWMREENHKVAIKLLDEETRT
jgi:hypothetical protein